MNLPESASSSMSGHLLFVQKRSVRAGAQVSLARLVQASTLTAHHPAVLLGCEGWLRDHLQETGLPHALVPFPSPRALTTRLTGFGPFGRAAKSALDKAGIRPRVIIANDHQECPL